MIKMIIATDKNFGIGKDNSIPWDCHEDMNYFKEQTENSIVVMGKNTYNSLPFENGLPNRKNYVMTNSEKFLINEGEDLKLPCFPCKDYSRQSYFCTLSFISNLLGFVKEDIWVIGGASIYQQLLPFVEEIHHTIIDGVYDCDTHFNMEFLEDWALVSGKNLSENAVVNIWRKSK